MIQLKVGIQGDTVENNAVTTPFYLCRSLEINDLKEKNREQTSSASRRE